MSEHLDFSTYDTPGECLAAVVVARTLTERNPDRDTLRLGAPDPLPASAAAVGTACGARFSAERVPASEVENLLELSIMLGQAASAQAVLTHWLAAPQGTFTDRGESVGQTQAKRLDEMIHLYSQNPVAMWRVGLPPDTITDHVHDLLRRLDVLGAEARYEQLTDNAYVVNNEIQWSWAQGRWDPAHDIQLVNGLLKRTDAATSFERQSVWGGWNRFGLASIFEAFLQARGFLDPHGLAGFIDSLQTHSPTAAMYGVHEGLFADETRDMSMQGTLVPPLAGTFWFNAHSLAVWPRPGRLSLLIVERFPYMIFEDRRTFWIARRLVAKYGARGLDVTVATKTQGFWLTDGIQTGPVPAAQEAADDSVYLLNDLKLPFTLAVTEAPLGRQANGHLAQSAPVQFDTTYGPGEGSSIRVVLSDRTGHLLYTSAGSFEAELEAYIERALGSER